MGMSESSFKTLTNPLQSCISEVLGSVDCIMKSKCCENHKCFDFYYHCRTITTTENLDVDDLETITCENLD